MSATATMPVTVVEVTTTAPQRVLSVDLLRGITIAMMILVNDPGDWEHVFKPLDHAEWNGWTVTDMVFPTFLFLMGASMVFSLSSRAERGNCRKTQAGHIALRALKIFALDLALAYFPRMNWQHMRIYGVLTRIALCYLLAGMVLLVSQRRLKVLWAVVAGLLVGYWVLLRWVPVPGFGMPGRDVPLLHEVGNLTAWMDRLVLGFTQHWLHTGRLFKHTSDPEGLLSTLPAVASVLLGSIAGIWMRAVEARAERGGWRMLRMQGAMAGLGVAGVVAGVVWGHWFPVNKNLWTSSYVLLAAGWAALALAVCSWLVDKREQPWPKWLRAATWPWFVFGSNAIAAFTVSVVVVEWLLFFKVTYPDGYRESWLEVAYVQGIGRWGSNEWTSLGFAVMFVVVCFVPVWGLWRKKWFLKI